MDDMVQSLQFDLLSVVDRQLALGCKRVMGAIWLVEQKVSGMTVGYGDIWWALRETQEVGKWTER